VRDLPFPRCNAGVFLGPDKVDESLRFALSQDCIDCFTIGAANRDELTDLIKRIPAVSQAAKAA